MNFFILYLLYPLEKNYQNLIKVSLCLLQGYKKSQRVASIGVFGLLFVLWNDDTLKSN